MAMHTMAAITPVDTAAMLIMAAVTEAVVLVMGAPAKATVVLAADIAVVDLVVAALAAAIVAAAAVVAIAVVAAGDAKKISKRNQLIPFFALNAVDRQKEAKINFEGKILRIATGY
jgi:hypothetical protein